MRCNFGLLGNINVIVKFCSASDVMHERRLALHDDDHLSSIIILYASLQVVNKTLASHVDFHESKNSDDATLETSAHYNNIITREFHNKVHIKVKR